MEKVEVKVISADPFKALVEAHFQLMMASVLRQDLVNDVKLFTMVIGDGILDDCFGPAHPVHLSGINDGGSLVDGGLYRLDLV